MTRKELFFRYFGRTPNGGQLLRLGDSEYFCQKKISREKKGEEFIIGNIIREFSSEEEDAFEEDTQTAAQRAIVVFKEPH